MSRIKIPVHVFGFSLAVAPAIAYAMYYRRNHPSDEDFEKTLRENYQHRIRDSQAKRQDMVKFFKGVQQHNAETEQQLEEVLRGGKGEMKRHFAVNKQLYGTEEGVEAKKRAEAELQRKQTNKKRQTKRAEKTPTVEAKAVPVDSSSDTTPQRRVDTQTVLTMAAVGTIAAAIGFFAGGSRS